MFRPCLKPLDRSKVTRIRIWSSVTNNLNNAYDILDLV